MSSRVPSESSSSNFSKWYDPEKRMEEGSCSVPELVFVVALFPLAPVLKMDTSTRTRKVVCITASTVIVSGAGAAAGFAGAGAGGAAMGAVVGAGLGLTIGIGKVLGDDRRNKQKQEQLVRA